MRLGLRMLLVPLATLAGAAAETEGAFTKAPRLLSETGLYQAGGTTVDPRNLPYAPQYPLWSDGAAKSRWIRLPAGATIDTKDPDHWDFPVGTRFWKEFSFGGRRVETRLIWKRGPKALGYATYDWKEDGSDAVLAPEAGVKDRFPLSRGKLHSLPSVEQCRRCHENGRPEVLGFTALQLSTDRDPLAPHAEPVPAGGVTLRTLADAKLLVPAREEWLQDPPRIRAGTPRARAALGYLSSNCGSCHTHEGPVADKGLFLRHLVGAKPGAPEPALATALGREGKWAIPSAAPGESRLIRPGAPQSSTALHRMKLRGTLLQMPPLASVLPDEAAIALLTEWIAEDLLPRK